MKIFAKTLILFLSLAGSLGCASMRPIDFSNNTPKFSIQDYFSTPRLGQGMFFDRFGTARTSFTAKLSGRNANGVLFLDELLTYSNGNTLKRTYVIKSIGENKFSLECPDLASPGTIEQSGNALQWKYSLKQDINGSIWTLKFNDWMFLQPDGETVLNRAIASKFGIDVGEVLMTVR